MILINAKRKNLVSEYHVSFNTMSTSILFVYVILSLG